MLGADDGRGAKSEAGAGDRWLRFLANERPENVNRRPLSVRLRRRREIEGPRERARPMAYLVCVARPITHMLATSSENRLNAMLASRPGEGKQSTILASCGPRENMKASTLLKCRRKCLKCLALNIVHQSDFSTREKRRENLRLSTKMSRDVMY